MTGAPHLARFSRDVGYHRGLPLSVSDESRVRGKEQWNPTSREKRARCGAPVIGCKEEGSGNRQVTLGSSGDLRAHSFGHLCRGSRATKITGVQRRIRRHLFDGFHYPLRSLNFTQVF